MPRSKNIKATGIRKVVKWNTNKIKKLFSDKYPHIINKELIYIPSKSVSKKIISPAIIKNIRCTVHSNFEITNKVASPFINGFSEPCDKCAKDKRKNTRALSTKKKFLNKINFIKSNLPNINFTKFEYKQNKGGQATIINIWCDEHPQQSITSLPGNLLKGHQPCKICQKKNVYRNSKGQLPTTTIESLKNIQKYDLSSAYIKKVREGKKKYNRTYLANIYCRIHKKYFEQRLDSYKKKTIGCKDCLNEKMSISENEIKIYLKENDLKIKLIYYTGKSKNINSKWKCLECGNVWENQFDQIKRYGCKVCADKIRIHNNKMTEKLARKLLYDNYKEEVNLISYGGSATASSIFKCGLNDDHGKWEVSLSAMLSNYSGCPVCKSSRGNRLIAKWLSENNISFISEKRFLGMKGIGNKPLRADFFIQDHNLVIEFDGRQHFEVVNFGGITNQQAIKNFQKVKANDKLKEQFLKKKKIKILRIKDTDNIEEKLHNLFISLKK